MPSGCDEGGDIVLWPTRVLSGCARELASHKLENSLLGKDPHPAHCGPLEYSLVAAREKAPHCIRLE